jgi:hypothetical protein
MNDEATPPGVITVGGLTMTTAQDQIGAALAKAQARVRKARKNAPRTASPSSKRPRSSRAPRACAGPCSTARASGCPAS